MPSQGARNVGAVGTDWSQKAVSNLDFELRKGREFQNSSRGVMAKAITPPSLLPTFLAPRDWCISCFECDVTSE